MDAITSIIPVPPEMMGEIFSHLTILQTLRTSRVSKVWHACIQNRVKVLSDETVAFTRFRFSIGWPSFVRDDRDRVEIVLLRAIEDFKINIVKNLLQVIALEPYKGDKALDKVSINPAYVFNAFKCPLSDQVFTDIKELTMLLLDSGFNLNQGFCSLVGIVQKFVWWPPSRVNDFFSFSVEKGLDINVQEESTGKTLLHFLFRKRGTYDETEMYHLVKRVDYMLELKADPTICDKKGRTPLGMAKGKNLTEVLRIFHRRGYKI